MKKLYFITGNKEKLKEFKDLLPNVVEIKLDLPEIQELNPKKIVEEKLKIALKTKKYPLIIEDTSLYLDSLNGFPGPLIKWLLNSIGDKGVVELITKYKNKKAVAKTIIGYADKKEIKFFEGETKGIIVMPTSNANFGWDSIFQPEKYNKTFNEMNLEEKNKISMRNIAIRKLKNYLKAKS